MKTKFFDILEKNKLLGEYLTARRESGSITIFETSHYNYYGWSEEMWSGNNLQLN